MFRTILPGAAAASAMASAVAFAVALAITACGWVPAAPRRYTPCARASVPGGFPCWCWAGCSGVGGWCTWPGGGCQFSAVSARELVN